MKRRIKQVSASAIAKTPGEDRTSEEVEYRGPEPGYHPWLYVKTPGYWWLELVRREKALGRRMTEEELGYLREELEVKRGEQKEKRAVERLEWKAWKERRGLERI